MQLGSVILHVLDVAEAVAFWERVFGLAARFVRQSGYAEMETGGTTLAFAAEALTIQHGLPPRRDGLPFGMEVGLVTSDVEAAYHRAVNAGATPILAPAARPWSQMVGYVRDLNGVLVELCTPIGS